MSIVTILSLESNRKLKLISMKMLCPLI